MLEKKMSVTKKSLTLAEFISQGHVFSGGEESIGDPDATAKAIQEAEEADLEGNATFNKMKQQAQQHESNATKSREEASAATSQLADANSEVESLKEQLATAETKASEAGIGNVELNEDDYSDTDLAMVKAIKKLEKSINDKDAKIGKLEKTADDFKADRQDVEAKAQREEAYQDILNDFDEDYGPEHRNAAVKEFDALCKDGKVKGGAAKATRILDKCYKNAVKAVKDADGEKNKNKSVTLDDGSGGGASVSLSGVELQEGSLEDVTKQAASALNG